MLQALNSSELNTKIHVQNFPPKKIKTSHAAICAKKKNSKKNIKEIFDMRK